MIPPRNVAFCYNQRLSKRLAVEKVAGSNVRIRSGPTLLPLDGVGKTLYKFDIALPHGK